MEPKDRTNDLESKRPILLSPPHMGEAEFDLLRQAFDSNWIAPLGPQVDAFEAEFAAQVGAEHAVALSSGTAALHLALLEAGVSSGDDVMVSTLTFVASVNPIRYVGANPVFIDCEASSWNMDPQLLEQALEERTRAGRRVGAVVVVHLYGQSADLDAIVRVCARYGVPLIEDAAEALGATYHGKQPGVFGQSGVFSFNGNKIITTSGGGMLVTADAELARHARKLSTQARDSVNGAHYEHSEIGYNYRMSNLLAAVGRGQLAVLEDRVCRRRSNFEFYEKALADVPGLTLQPEAHWGDHSRWLTCILVDPQEFGANREDLRSALERESIESRPFWKPMHLQPIFRGSPVFGGGVSEWLFERGLCLPSGSQMTDADLLRVTNAVRAARVLSAAS